MKLTDDLVTNLVAVTDSAATLHAVVCYKDIYHREGDRVVYGSKFTTVTNASIAICAAAAAGITRCIESISIGEAANAAELVSVSTAPATLVARAKLIKVNLAAYCRLVYTPTAGWAVFAADGTRFQQVA